MEKSADETGVIWNSQPFACGSHRRNSGITAISDVHRTYMAESGLAAAMGKWPGGFNLQIAWSTGYAAGLAAVGGKEANE